MTPYDLWKLDYTDKRPAPVMDELDEDGVHVYSEDDDDEY